LEEVKDNKKDRFSNYETIYVKFDLTKEDKKPLYPVGKVKIGKYWLKKP